MKKTIFITGCCGYIGSHTCVELLNSGYQVIGLDNFSNSSPDILNKIWEITGRKINFYEGNMLDQHILEVIFQQNDIDLVIDFAAYKSVGDSLELPIEYYHNNVSSVLTLLSVMKAYHVQSLIFSSSATVYGTSGTIPVTEESPTGNTTNPYGTSKLYVENILQDVYKSDKKWSICIFRYFNPVGAHKSGLIGENMNGFPSNLMPCIIKTVLGEIPYLNIFGNDYNTKDGTGVRDYIHIVDLARAHINAIEKLQTEKNGLYIYNLGTGTGYSVFDVLNAFYKVNGVKVNYKIIDRRSGDVEISYADPTKAKVELGWQAEYDIEDMCRDAYCYAIRSSGMGN